MLIGDAHVSIDEQPIQLQKDALTAAGCEDLYQDMGIRGNARDRPGLAEVLAGYKPYSDTR